MAIVEAKTHLTSLEALLLDALIDAEAHLDYCGYGDSWEHECATHAKLPEKIEAAVAEGKRRAAGG